MDLKEQIRTVLGINKGLKLAYQNKLTDGTIIVSEAEELAAGVSVMVLAEDGTTMPLPIGEYETTDGTSFSVVEEGVVAEIYEAETEEEEEKVEAQEEEVAEEEVVEETVEEAVAVIEDNTAAVADAINEATPEEVTPEIAEAAAEAAVAVLAPAVEEEVTLSKEMKTVLSIIRKELKTLKGKNSKLKTQKANLKRKVAKLSKQPADRPVKVSKFNDSRREMLSTEDYRKLTKKEKYWYNIRNK